MAQAGLNDEENGGRNSRWTVPLTLNFLIKDKQWELGLVLRYHGDEVVHCHCSNVRLKSMPQFLLPSRVNYRREPYLPTSPLPVWIFQQVRSRSLEMVADNNGFLARIISPPTTTQPSTNAKYSAREESTLQVDVLRSQKLGVYPLNLELSGKHQLYFLTLVRNWKRTSVCYKSDFANSWSNSRLWRNIDKTVLAIPFSLNLSIAMKLNNTFVIFLLQYARMFSRHRFNVGKM